MKNILNFRTLPKKEQIRRCAEIFRLEAKYALDYVEKLPNFSTFIPEALRAYVKWCAVPNTSANLNAYEKLINKLVDIKNTENINYDWRGYTWYNLKSIKQNNATIDFLDKISSWQAGDILLLPVVIRKHENNFPEEILAGLESNVFPLGLQTTMSIALLNNIKGLNFACLGDSCYYDNARPDMYGYDEEYASVIRHDDIPHIKLNSKIFSFAQQEYNSLLVDKYSMYVFCPYENLGEVNSCEILNRPTNYLELLELYIQKFPMSSDKIWFHHFSDFAEYILGKNLRYQMDFDDFENWFEKNVNSSEVQAMFLKHEKIMKKLLKEDYDKKMSRKWTIEHEIAFQITAINHPERLVFGTPQGLFDND